MVQLVWGATLAQVVPVTFPSSNLELPVFLNKAQIMSYNYQHEQ